MLPTNRASERTLTVCCYAGLGNRLRVLISAMALAEVTGRRLAMHWPRTDACGAVFPELFANSIGVTDSMPPQDHPWPKFGAWFDPRLPNLTHSAEPHIALCTTDWLIQPAFYPAQALLLKRCAALLAALEPARFVSEQVAAFKSAHFRPAMIGVHLRRGDFWRAQPASARNTAQALAAVERFLAQAPEAGIFLSTDDGAEDPWTHQPMYEGVRARFAQRFGERVVSRLPRSLARNSPEASQDALIDLLLLRETDWFVGTQYSSFSEMAFFGRTANVELCHAPALRGPWARLVDKTGLATMYGQLMRRRYGHDIPPHVLWNHVTQPARLVLRGLVKRRLPGLYQWVRAQRGLPPSG